MRRHAALLLLLLGCAPGIRPPGSEPVVTERLYFGRNIGDTLGVTDSLWGIFLRDVVTVQLPDGFTHWNASGQWRGANGRIVLEPTYILEVNHPRGSAAADSAIGVIIGEYKRRFRQEAVLRVVTPSRASF